MITSTSNPQIKRLALLGKNAKERHAQGVFLAEGRKMLKEVPAEWICRIYVSESYRKDSRNMDGLRGMEYEELSDHAMRAASGMETPQGILLELSIPKWDLSEILRQAGGPILFLEDIQDPGNLGTMLRTAEAAGASAVIASCGTADLYNPKAVRATMGSICRMPFFSAEDFHETIRQAGRCGIRIYAAHLNGACIYDEPDYRGRCGFLIGNEGSGLADETAALADMSVKIPMEGRTESLNAASAAAVLLYEAHRQKRR